VGRHDSLSLPQKVKMEVGGESNVHSIRGGIDTGHSRHSSCSLARTCSASLIFAVPEAVIGVVATYLQPPDVYHLLTVLDNDRTNGGSRGLVPFCGRPQSESILAASLEKSLKRAVQSNKVSFREDIDMCASFARLAAELAQSPGTRPRLSLGLTNGLRRGSPAVAMSGGIMVQAALGETWGDSDVDIYCTEAAAPSVRAWLIRDMKQVLVGVNSRYTSFVPWSIKDPVDHVEYWANTPVDGKQFKIGKRSVWEFDYNEVCHNGPVGFHGNRMFDGAEPMDDDYHGFLMTTKDNIPVPYEPRLLHACDNKGRRKTKKEIVGIDLIVVKAGDTIARVIHGFDFDICQCSWDGLGSFFVPAPGNTFRRISNLSTGHQANEMLFYSKCITVESQKTFEEMMKELQAKRGRLAGLWAGHLKELESNDATHADLLRHLPLVIDKFNVFSPEFDWNLPLEILLLTRELREMLIQNVLERPGVQGHRVHNLIMKSLERLEKYERRGITIKPHPSPCEALRALPTKHAPRPRNPHFSNSAERGLSYYLAPWIVRMDDCATSEHRIRRSVALKPVGRSSHLERWENYRQLVFRAREEVGSAGAARAVTRQGARWEKKRKLPLPLLPEL
jgi:hypothetical protein